MDENENNDYSDPVDAPISSPEPSGIDLGLGYTADNSPYPGFYFEDHSPCASPPATPDPEPAEEILLEAPSAEPVVKPKRKRENRYKNAPPSVLSRRRAQNRASQRAYRERKDQRIKDLEAIINEMQKSNEALKAENMMLKSQQQNQAQIGTPQFYPPGWNGTITSNMLVNLPCECSMSSISSHSPAVVGNITHGDFQPNNSILYDITQFSNRQDGIPYKRTRFMNGREPTNAMHFNPARFLNDHEEGQSNSSTSYDGIPFSNG
ncbi:hypothetical protein F5Y10DRAFT_256939 [Nemania abortiva]|nr:hypothetical protein F5Y10DRAFT_256939 [Nemania abortiva]